VLVSGFGAGGMHKGSGGSLLVWIERIVLVLFAALLTGGIGRLAHLTVVVDGFVIAVILDQERR